MKRQNPPQTDSARRTMTLKAGTRVRVRKEVDSPLAGRKGVVMYVGDGVCDVKVVEKTSGRGGSEITIETLPKAALESLRPNVDLVSMSTHSRCTGWVTRLLWGGAAAAVACVAAWAVYALH